MATAVTKATVITTLPAACDHGSRGHGCHCFAREVAATPTRAESLTPVTATHHAGRRRPGQRRRVSLAPLANGAGSKMLGPSARSRLVSLPQPLMAHVYLHVYTCTSYLIIIIAVITIKVIVIIAKLNNITRYLGCCKLATASSSACGPDTSNNCVDRGTAICPATVVPSLLAAALPAGAQPSHGLIRWCRRWTQDAGCIAALSASAALRQCTLNCKAAASFPLPHSVCGPAPIPQLRQGNLSRGRPLVLDGDRGSSGTAAADHCRRNSSCAAG